jgi:hypothetical protein
MHTISPTAQLSGEPGQAGLRYLVRLYLHSPLPAAHAAATVAAAGRHKLLLSVELCGVAAQPGQVRHVPVLPLPNQACGGGQQGE